MIFLSLAHNPSSSQSPWLGGWEGNCCPGQPHKPPIQPVSIGSEGEPSGGAAAGWGGAHGILCFYQLRRDAGPVQGAVGTRHLEIPTGPACPLALASQAPTPLPSEGWKGPLIPSSAPASGIHLATLPCSHPSRCFIPLPDRQQYKDILVFPPTPAKGNILPWEA